MKTWSCDCLHLAPRSPSPRGCLSPCKVSMEERNGEFHHDCYTHQGVILKKCPKASPLPWSTPVSSLGPRSCHSHILTTVVMHTLGTASLQGTLSLLLFLWRETALVNCREVSFLLASSLPWFPSVQENLDHEDFLLFVKLDQAISRH